MAEQVEDFRFHRKGYDWDRWFDGHYWRLKRGVDFSCKANSFRMTAQKAARRQGLHLQTQVEGDELITMRAIPRSS